MTRDDQVAFLRRRFAARDLVVAPCAFDALSARIIAQAGFPATFMSGFGVAAARYGLPDNGLIGYAEMVETLRLICAANPGLPVIGDGDTGYGNAMNVRATVIGYARAGAAAIMIEDQLAPKKCGHMESKVVVPLEEARTRIRAAVDARRESGLDIVIVARTDARAPHGFDDAMARLRAFRDEGADLLFLEAPADEAELARFAREIAAPAMANMVPGGKTPILTPDTLRAMGFAFGIYHQPLFGAIEAMRRAMDALAAGDPAGIPIAPFADVKRIAGAEEYDATAAHYRSDDPLQRAGATVASRLSTALRLGDER
jgi:2-methylisocitrate lyase-like PEP mutase family enzyme